MSGVVNIVTKDGDNKFTGNIQIYSGDYYSNRKNIFMNIDHINPLTVQNFDASLSGPIIRDKLFSSPMQDIILTKVIFMEREFFYQPM